MTELEVQAEMQAYAREVYGITSPEELAHYTSHSVRVGACVALHASGASTPDIQFCLRWTLDKFKNYLRHVIQIAETHNLFMNKLQPDGTLISSC